MVQKEVTLKILADVDDSQVEDLENVLQQIIDKRINVPVDVDTDELEQVESDIEDVKSELSELQAKVEVDNSEIESLESELEDLEAQKLELDVETDIGELELLESQIADIENSLSSLQASVEVDNTEIQSLETELADLEAREIELTGQVNVSGVDEAAQGLNDVEQSAENASSALEAMAMIDIAGALSQWGSQAEGFAQELDNIAISSEQLAIQTGMTDAEMTGMLNHITNATFPREEALMYVKSLDQIGVSAQNLGASATGLDRINDAFHLGAEKTNRLGQELSVLGVDMNNVSSSFNALAYANANTVGGMDNYFSFLQRYDAQFKELGMNVDQASVAIAAATQKFGGGRAALTGMNQALKNCNGDMSVLEQELGLTAGSLSNASELTGQYAGQLDAMADKEGEHKTLTQQLAAALDDVTASLTGTISPFASFLGMIGNAGSFAVGINGLWELTSKVRGLSVVDSITGKFRNLRSGLTNIASSARNAAVSLGTTLKNALTGAATAAKEAVLWLARTSKELLVNAANALKSAAAWVWEKAVKVASTIATKAMTAAQWLLNIAMSANPVTLIVIAIIALIAILWYLYNTCEPVRNAIDAIWAGVSGAIQPIIDSVQWLIDKLTQLANGDWSVTIEIAKAGASAGVEGIFDVANNDLSRGLFKAIAGDEALAQADEGMPILKEKLTSSFNEMLDSIWNDGTQGFLGWLAGIAGIDVGSYLTGLQTSFNQIPQWVNQASQGAIQAFQGMLNGVSVVLNNIINNVINFGSRLVSTISNAARNAWNSFVNSIKGMWKHMAEEVDSILSQADRLLRELPGKLWNAAVNMVRGWLTGSGEGSPGFMYYAFEEDLGAMERISRNNNIADNMGATARDMVSSWGKPSLSYPNIDLDVNRSNGGDSDVTNLLTRILEVLSNQRNTGNVTFNHYGDTDDEDKMYRILEFIQRAVDWDNETAGRKVGGA